MAILDAIALSMPYGNTNFCIFRHENFSLFKNFYFDWLSGELASLMESKKNLKQVGDRSKRIDKN